MPRPSKKTENIETLKMMYLEDKLSLSEISRQMGQSVQTLSRWLQSEGIALEPRNRNPNAGRTKEVQAEINARISETKAQNPEKKRGGRTSLPREARTCEVCGQGFEALARSVQRTCCQGHGLWLANQKKMERARAEWEANPDSRCRCGKTVPFEYRHDWKYCSKECRDEFGAKRQPNPDNYITFTCENPACGKDVTRYKNYGNGANRFCSNECAAKANNLVKIRIDDVCLDSGWEALFWGLCRFLKISIERVDRSLAVEWGYECWYAPDFILMPSGNKEPLYIEIKGMEDGDDPEKWNRWRKLRGPLAVVTHKELDILRKLSTAQDVLYGLWNFGWL